ncbi:clumping factor A [Neoarius graeffei]|uniref:clumping factor A n=1 Tax=Neoarius graeffei TaxID=443677 RepID=UPI00298BFAE2|nr:clumping factor A [Neoarius graeffei]
MAASLFRIGRLGTLKCLQQDGWGSLRSPLTAAFCTKAEAPKKPAKKAKTCSQPDERAALLAYKTTVAFPTRLSTPGFLSQGVALGESERSGDPMTGESAAAAASAEPVPSAPQVSAEASSEERVSTADATQAESVVDGSAKAETESRDVAAERAAEKDVTSPTSADVKAPKDAPSSSSSSSDSDSDSDSDDDDDDDEEKPDKTEMTEPVVKPEDKAGQEEMSSAVSEEPASDTKTRAVPERGQPSAPERALKGAPEVAKAVREPTSEEPTSPSTAAAVSSEDIIDPAPVSCTAESIKGQAEVGPEKEASVEVKSSEVPHAIPEPATEGAPDIAAKPTPDVVRDPATEVGSGSEVEIKVAPKTTEAAAAHPEELIDPAPVITDAEEVVTAEPEVAAAPEEAAPEPEPEPEPFDNTTYKNLQHHSYSTYTFMDMDVEMAKHRLPQPSTGRSSPKH